MDGAWGGLWRWIGTWSVFVCLLCTSAASALPPLVVSDDGRRLVRSDGEPFTWLADTGWALFSTDQTLEEVELYLNNRVDKRFTVIQALVPAGIRSFVNGWEGVFARMDQVVERADELGLYLAVVPEWAGNAIKPEFTLDNAYDYGVFLGERYGQYSIVWMLGGDHQLLGAPEERAQERELWRALARGIAIGTSGAEDYEQVTMTFHPRGTLRSGRDFHDEVWLDFNMAQSGHWRGRQEHYSLVEQDYALNPPKPTVNGEPGYENIPDRLMRGNDKLTDWDVRKFSYWSLLAGAFGVTYGCNEAYMFWDPGENGWGAEIWGADTPWRQAMDLPGAFDMQHVRALIESRPAELRAPNQSIIVSDAGDFDARVQAAVAIDGSYAFVYSPHGAPVAVDLSKISGEVLAWWFDPREGTTSFIARHPNAAAQTFVPPTSGDGQDWVLILDDASRGYGQLNECVEGIDNCNDNAQCTDTPDGFECRCNQGFGGDGVICVDLDECGDGTDDCDEQADCQNTIGGFECACRTGYSGDGKTCVAGDLCATPTFACDEHASCRSDEGVYACVCRTGYVGDGFTCTDINECADTAANRCADNALCTNTEGSYECACPAGYVGDGSSCVSSKVLATGCSAAPNAAGRSLCVACLLGLVSLCWMRRRIGAVYRNR